MIQSSIVVGPTIGGATDAGDAPVKVAGTDAGGSVRTLRTNNNGELVIDTELAAASALADDDANPTTSRIGANVLGFDGATWDRIRAALPADALANPAAALWVLGALMGWNGVAWDRLRAVTPADNLSNPSAALAAAALAHEWDGSTWDRVVAPARGAGGTGTNVTRVLPAIPATGPSTETSIPATSTSTQVLAANASRHSAMVRNDSATVTVRVAIGEAAGAASLELPPQETVVLVGSGAVNAWNNGGSAATVQATDFTY